MHHLMVKVCYFLIIYIKVKIINNCQKAILIIILKLRKDYF